MQKLLALLSALALAAPISLPAVESNQNPRKPNVIYILADDLGYGDVQCLNPERGKIKTPHIDRLAAEGMIFTDAHTGSSVCTPTRYGILTGRYAWRSRLQSGVLGGFSPPLIEQGRLTVPALLRQAGYHTACIGKWHLGLGWPRHDDGKYDDRVQSDKEERNKEVVDWDKPIENGPITCGFDEFFGTSASLDMPPFVFIRNNRVTVVPTVEKKWVRSGPAAADFEAVNVLPAFVAEAVAQIQTHTVDSKAGKPFFLYLALTSPHTPIVPSAEWRGKSGLGEYGDFVMQTDAAVGEVLAAVDKAAIAEDTLVIFTSDNGCSPAAGVEKLEAQGHYPSANLRGYKSDIWDGGHRVPFVVRWPGNIKPGSQSSQLICSTDLMATLADMLHVSVAPNAGEDSVSILPALLGTDTARLRQSVIHHSIDGRFAIREGNWKLELCGGSGGWGKPGDADAKQTGLPDVQLYDLRGDIGETKNVFAAHTDLVTRLTQSLKTQIEEGRTTPGEKQKNDVEVKMFKPAKPSAK